MTFYAGSRRLGALPPQASVNGLGRLPPQASVNGFGALPPQASVNGLGRYGMIGMLPPQAAAGVGDDMTPTSVPEGEPSAWRDGVFGGRRAPEPFGEQTRPWQDGIFSPPLALSGRGRLRGMGDDETTPSGVPEGEPGAWRDGVFGGRRAPEPFGEQTRPWQDGIFSPPLGIGRMGRLGDATAPTIMLDGERITELKMVLSYVNAAYTATPGTAYDTATESAYLAFVNTSTPDYTDKAPLLLVVAGQQYPSARGIYVLLHAARMAWALEAGEDESYNKVAFFYPELWTFALAFQGSNYAGTVTVPTTGGFKTSSVVLMGLGAITLGLLAAFMLPKKRLTSNPRRRRARRRRR